MNSTPDKQELLKKIAQRELANREREKQKNEAFFRKITTGIAWKVFIGGAALCLLLSILFTIDSLADGEVVSITENDFKFDRSKLVAYGYQSVWVDNEIYTPSFEELYGFDEHSFKVHYSPIFHDPKYITFNSDLGDDIPVMRRLSLYEYFPFVELLLLIPLIVVLYKRQNGVFYFLWALSILFVDTCAIYMLLVRLA